MCFLVKLIRQSVQSLSHVQLFETPWTAAHQASLSITNSQCSNSCPSSWWCHTTISSPVVPFSTCFQYFPASGFFPMSLLIRWPKYWFHLQHQSFPWIFRTEAWSEHTYASFVPLKWKVYSKFWLEKKLIDYIE